jgi:hypothetical protein
VQNVVPWERRGVATGTVQFFRSIGGALSVAALGALLAARLAAAGAGDPDALLEPALRATLEPGALAGLRDALRHGLTGVYRAAAGIAAALLLVACLTPGGAAREATDRPS